MATPINWCLKTICPIVPQGELSANIHATTASVPAEIWDSLALKTSEKSANPFLSHAFFLALEQSGSAIPQTGWQPQHIVLHLDNKPVGLLPLFLKSHSQGEYVFDHAWADAVQRAGGHYYPKLQASIPFTPVTTPKFLVPDGNIGHKFALMDTSIQLANQLGASSVHATFVMPDEENLAEENNWLTRRDTQFHWQNDGFANFESFLSNLASRKRKSILRERKKALESNIKIDWIEGADITENHWDRFFEFYQDTGARKWGQPYLTRSFFSYLSQNMPAHLTLMMAREGDEYIAGALNFSSADTLYGRYWGCTRDVPFLHFELCYYQAIDYAITKGLKTVEAGAQGQHKLARGYLATPTRSIHWLQNPGLRKAVKDYLHHERLAVDQDQQVLNLAAPFKK